MVFLQRAHPTNPSRCVDFDAYLGPWQGSCRVRQRDNGERAGVPSGCGGLGTQSCSVRCSGKRLASACLLAACLPHSWVADLGRVAAEALLLWTCKLCIAAVPFRL